MFLMTYGPGQDRKVFCMLFAFLHNKLKLLQHCELNGPNFLVFSLQTKLAEGI